MLLCAVDLNSGICHLAVWKKESCWVLPKVHFLLSSTQSWRFIELLVCKSLVVLAVSSFSGTNRRRDAGKGRRKWTKQCIVSERREPFFTELYLSVAIAPAALRELCCDHTHALVTWLLQCINYGATFEVSLDIYLVQNTVASYNLDLLLRHMASLVVSICF